MAEVAVPDTRENIEDVAVGLEDSQDYQEFTTRLGDLTQQSEDTVTQALENRQKATDCHAKAMQELDAYKEELANAIHRHVEAIRNKAGQILDQDTDKMNKLASEGNKVLTELRTMETEVNNLKSQKHFSKLFLEIKQRNQSLRDLQGNVEDLSDDKVTAYTFQPDDDFVAMIDSRDGLKQLVITSPEREVAKHMKASLLIDINVKSTSNKNLCTIPGMTLVNADTVVVADNMNDTVKVIDTTNCTILSEHKLEVGMPWDVATCGDTIAVTCPLGENIVFLKYTSELVHDRTIRVQGSCRGIDWHDDKLYVMFDDKKKLEVMTPAGIVLQTFSTNAEGEPLFEYPSYMTVSSADKRIYVSEYMKGRVVVLDMDGNQVGVYEDDELGSPRQLAVGGAGVMFLCDLYHKVHLMSPDGEKVKILLTKEDGVDEPYSVCYCKETRRLYIGMSNCNTIKVYNIS